METGPDTAVLPDREEIETALGANSEPSPEVPNEGLTEIPTEVLTDSLPEPMPEPARETPQEDAPEVQTQPQPKARQRKKKEKKQKREKAAVQKENAEEELSRSVVCLQEVNSSEFEINDAGAMRPLIRNVSVEVFRGEVWGIGAGNAYEADVLCQIIGNMRPYYNGYCRIGPIGIMRFKRRILSHLFYIDAPNQMPHGMTVLEQLMLCTAKSPECSDAVSRQKMLLEFLVEAGLSHLALSRDTILLETERLLVQLIAAVYSDSVLIVCNFVSYPFSQEEIQSLKRINQLARERDKALIIATMQPKLIGMTCGNVLFLRHGKVGYCGTVEDMIRAEDNVFCMLSDENASDIAARLKEVLPGFHCEVSGQQIFLHNVAGVVWDRGALYQLLAEYGLYPEQVKINRGRAENSFVELMRQYDL